MSLDDRLALVCLRAVVQDLEASGGAGEVLARVLSRTDASGTIARSEAPVADRDLKPAKITKRPAARRRETRSARPAPAAVEHEAAGLVRALEERHGDLATAAAALGVRVNVLGTWRAGRITPTALARLREAAHAPVGKRTRFGDKPRPAQGATTTEEAAGEDPAVSGAEGTDDEGAGAA